MHAWPRAFLGVLLVGAVAVAGIALNFTLLRMTQDAHDPVGKLSPRAVFPSPTGAGPVTTVKIPTDRPDDGDSDD